MENIVFLFDLSISNLSTSGINVSNSIPTVIVNSFIAFCTAAKGGGIYIAAGEIMIYSTCIYKCAATVQGSAINSAAKTDVNFTSVSRCSDINEGYDDSINIDDSPAKVTDLNSSYCSNTESCGLQLSSSPKIEILRNIYAHGKGSHVFQHNHLKFECSHMNEIFVNNSVSSCTIALVIPILFKVQNCIFKDNRSPCLFGPKGVQLPTIVFEDVAFMDDYLIGTSLKYKTSTNLISFPGPKQETFICRMIIELCSHKPVHIMQSLWLAVWGAAVK